MDKDKLQLIKLLADKTKLDKFIAEDEKIRQYLITISKNTKDLVDRLGKLEGVTPKMFDKTNSSVSALENKLTNIANEISANVSKLSSSTLNTSLEVKTINGQTKKMISDFDKSVKSLANELTVIQKVVDDYSSLVMPLDGKNGRGIDRVEVNKKHLIVFYDDGTQDDLGVIVPDVENNPIRRGTQGLAGKGGLDGAKGDDGAAGVGVVIGGTTGQVLAKKTNANYDTEWITTSATGLELGELSTNAYYGDKGKTAYDHSQTAHAPSDAEKNVQADWNQATNTADDYIKNKPTIPTVITDHTALSNIGTTTHSNIDLAIAKFNNDVTLKKEPTGFTDNSAITVTYNPTGRTITLTGTFEGYYRGVKVTALTNGWVSDPHPITLDKTYFLRYNGSAFVFDENVWTFDNLMIAVVQYGTLNKIAIKETHGFMPWESHFNAHYTIGTYKTAGGTLTTGSWSASSTTAANRRPLVDQTTIYDEDLMHEINALTTETYTQKYLVGSGAVRTFVLGAGDILPVTGATPYWNQNNGGTWQQTPMANNDYAAVWLTAIPVTNDAGSQSYRYIWTQPQSVSTTLATIRALTPSDINIGESSSLVSEFVFTVKVIIRMVSNNWTITEVQNLTGNRFNQTGSPQGSYLSIVATDATITGDGTSATPLSVVPFGISRSVSTISTNSNLGNTAKTDYVSFVTGTTTVTLPTAVGNTNRYTIKSITGTTIVACNGAETIDGSATIGIQNEDSVDLISNNTEWKVI